MILQAFTVKLNNELSLPDLPQKDQWALVVRSPTPPNSHDVRWVLYDGAGGSMMLSRAAANQAKERAHLCLWLANDQPPSQQTSPRASREIVDASASNKRQAKAQRK